MKSYVSLENEETIPFTTYQLVTLAIFGHNTNKYKHSVPLKLIKRITIHVLL